jgi:hypothetical protein
VNHWPKGRKEATYKIKATHNLAGITVHPDAQAPHEHEWRITCIFVREINCALGFGRDEADIEQAWGGRLRELDGQDLSALMKLPATAENFACWLLFFWLPRLGNHKLNFELDGVRVSKCDTYSFEMMRTQQSHDGWKLFGGEVV